MNRRNFLALTPAFPVAAVSASLVLREEGKKPIELGINVLNLRDGDRLVLTFPESISADGAARVKTMVEQALPKVKALLFTDGMKIEGVLRNAD
jgi:hypothetical protein